MEQRLGGTGRVERSETVCTSFNATYGCSNNGVSAVIPKGESSAIGCRTGDAPSTEGNGNVGRLMLDARRVFPLRVAVVQLESDSG